MPNNIYKRQPVVHELPYRWSDYDAVKFSNLNNITGLQHYDNPLIGSQNATYDCKNVYQDESGNLTVRPALRHIASIDTDDEVLGYYETSCGTLVHTRYYDGNEYTYHLYKDSSSEPVLNIGPGNITMQESDGLVYILSTTIDGKLDFRYFDGEAFHDVVPDLPINNRNAPVSRLYNLLSDQTKYETLPVLPKDATDELFTDFVGTTLNKPDALDYAILESGHIIFVYSTDITVAVPYGSTFRFVEIPVEITADAKILIEDIKDDIGCIVNVLTNSGSRYKRTQYNVYYTGDITSSSWSITEKNAFACELGYDNSLFVAVPVKLSDEATYTVEMTWYKDGIIATEKRWTYANTFANGDIDNVGVKIAVSKQSLCVLLASFRNNVESSNMYIAAIDLVSWISADKPYKSYLTEKYGYGRWSYIDVLSGYNNWYLLELDLTIPTIRTSLDYTNYGADGTLVGKPVHVAPIYPQFDISGNSVFVSTKDGLLVYTADKYYYIAPTVQRTYDFDDINESAVFNLDSTVLIDKLDTGYTLKTRNILPQYIEAKREVTDTVPVLSEIEDNVVTSFYLDNIYWFVTKHRVFGTGVANEQFSIKYFDPRKYFHFDETITGAIRISDSSFWVFHANGAYLIYKSSSEIYDELSGEYIQIITWLCTSTAESKGCDFENGLLTLPVTSYVASVTSDDISVVQMRENVQTDDRILVPMTLALRKFVASLLNETEKVVTAVYKYNALFFLNPVTKNGTVPTLVYNATSDSWWYWELPLNSIQQATITETNVKILGSTDAGYSIYDFYTEYYDYKLGGLTYHIYADRILSNEPSQIEWFWKSSLLHFDSVDYRKQLLFTNFNLSERESKEITFEYNFEVYDNEGFDSQSTTVETVVERTQCYSSRTMIARFRYLQLYLKNSGVEDDYSGCSRPKFSSISFKYRLLHLAGGTL